jgi:hypothetical protein
MRVPGLLAIDPGAVHIGTALFADDTCVKVEERAPDSFDWWLWGTLNDIDIVVCEDFQLWPETAQRKAWSRLAEVKCIGHVEAVIAMFAVIACHPVELVMQSPSCQQVAEAQAQARHVTLRSRGSGPHCKSAELHGYYHLWRTGKAKL